MQISTLEEWQKCSESRYLAASNSNNSSSNISLKEDLGWFCVWEKRTSLGCRAAVLRSSSSSSFSVCYWKIAKQENVSSRKYTAQQTVNILMTSGGTLEEQYSCRIVVPRILIYRWSYCWQDLQDIRAKLLIKGRIVFPFVSCILWVLEVPNWVDVIGKLNFPRYKLSNCFKLVCKMARILWKYNLTIVIRNIDSSSLIAFFHVICNHWC